MTSKNAWKFIVIAYTVVIFALLIAWIVGIQAWGDIFSLGQLLVDAVLLPVAVIGFLIAAEEFKKSQTKPDIDLYWETESGEVAKELTLETPLQGNANLPFRPALLNTGEAVGVWYMLSLTLPDELGSVEFAPLLGETDNWRVARTGEGLLLTFMSNGQIAAYPDYSLLLCTLRVNYRMEKEYAAEYKAPYTIVSDWGQRRDDFLILKLRQSVSSSA